MLPKQGFVFSRYQAVLYDTENQWEAYGTNGHGWDAAVEELLRMPVVMGQIKALRLTNCNPPCLVRKALMLLEQALGSQVLVSLFRFDKTSCILAMFPFAKFTVDDPAPASYEKYNLQLEFLTAVIEHLVIERGGRHAHQYLVQILDSLHMPFSTHQIIYTHVNEAVKARKITYQ